MNQPKKLIEVAMPITEISAECLRDDRIQHGHISSLHKWWARRPLPVCRAVVFASLVPDPLDPLCPKSFKEAVAQLLNKGLDGDPYKPYEDIPYTAGIDKMEDNLRNRLLMFIGKFSHTYIRNEHQGKTTPAKDQLSAFSLIKWDSKNDEYIINKARKLIWVSHNAPTGKDANELINEFDAYYQAIKESETALYSTQDRHLSSPEIVKKENRLHTAIEDFLDRMPKVFDPFAGGGAIPLEAARLGCRSFGNDINPVAHIIQKGSLEFPQKFGKPIVYSRDEFVKLYGDDTWKQQPQENQVTKGNVVTGIRIHNRLSFDVEYFAKKLLASTEKEIGHFYPVNEKGNKPIAYYWTRVGICSNPSCKAEVPLLKQFYLANTKSKQVYLEPVINGKQVGFRIKKGKYDETKITGWNNRGNLNCPFCGSITDSNIIKSQSISNTWKQRILAVIEDSENGKSYRLPTQREIEVADLVPYVEPPNEKMQRNSAGGDMFGWGVTTWGQLFSPRQIYALNTLVEKLKEIKEELLKFEAEYQKAVVTFLGIWIDRIVARMTMFGLIDLGGEKVVDLFGRQAIPMVFDYPEVNPFKMDQLSWVIKYIESESGCFNSSIIQNSSSGERSQFEAKSLTAVVTDPPYYDAVAYADLSDFFYVWLKKSIGDIYSLVFATPQTPKQEECTALKHHHGGLKQANIHFENKLKEIFSTIEHQTKDLVSIMFAHQTTKAWSTLCNSIINGEMNITGSWAIRTEKKGGLKEKKAYLSSSVTVCARPIKQMGIGDYKDVKSAIQSNVTNEVDELYKLGFRGADLLTACFGKAASEFGQYQSVEKADGTKVSITELLDMAKESAFNALLKGFDGDDFTKFYIGWLQLYGFQESNFDDAAKFSRVGLSIDVSELFSDHILIKNKNKQALGGYRIRNEKSKSLGEKATSHLIDQVHHAMLLFDGKNRNALLTYLSRTAQNPDGSFWRVITSLVEVLPTGSDDHKAALELLSNKDNLLRESRDITKGASEQTKLEL